MSNNKPMKLATTIDNKCFVCPNCSYKNKIIDVSVYLSMWSNDQKRYIMCEECHSGFDTWINIAFCANKG